MITTCNHDFLSPATTLCVSSLERKVWCVYCRQQRELKPLNDDMVKIALEAKYLRSKRPMVIPGTRAIIAEAEACVWHAEVTQTIRTLKLKPHQVTAFCNACGVAE